MDLHTRIQRAYGAIECEKVMSRHVYWHSAGIHRWEYENYWSKRVKITWGHGWGQQSDRYSYYNSYVLAKEQNAFKSFREIYEAYPDAKNCTFADALAEYSNHITTSPIIEMADDGLSGKGLFYTPGFINGHCSSNGQIRSQMLWERYGADFVLEDGKWLYVNLRITPDCRGNVGFGGFGESSGMGGPGGMPAMPGGAPGAMPGGPAPNGAAPGGAPGGMPGGPAPDGAAPGGAPGAMPGPGGPGGPGGAAPGGKKKKGGMPGADTLIAPCIPGPTYRDWSELQVPQHEPPVPEPYTTWDETWHYDDIHTLED